jgi:asparagine synthase (glutamine-hydrolysing)
LHQRSDVPYGLFLSGGIDSSALLACMTRLSPRPVRTFTVGFGSTQVKDERPLANKLAAELHAVHTEINFDENDFWQLLPKVAGALDDPTTDFAALPTYKLAAEAAGSVKVVLTGEGGDECFGGYGRYRRAAREPLWPPKFFRKADAHGKSGSRIGGGETLMQIAQAHDIANWLPNDLLLKLDRCLMAHGLEGRVPYTDPVVAAFAFRLPDKLKMRGRLGKYILRKWLAKTLPSAMPFSRKRGFSVPVHDWIGRKAERIAPLVARQPGVAQLYDPEAVRRLFLEANQPSYLERWSLLFFACWHQHHIRKVSGARDAFEHLSG